MRLLRRIQRWWHESLYTSGYHHWRCVRVRTVIPQETEKIGTGILFGTPGVYEALLKCPCGASEQMNVRGYRCQFGFVPLGVSSDIEWGEEL